MGTVGRVCQAEQAAGTKAVNRRWLVWLEGVEGACVGEPGVREVAGHPVASRALGGMAFPLSRMGLLWAQMRAKGSDRRWSGG